VDHSLIGSVHACVLRTLTPFGLPRSWLVRLFFFSRNSVFLSQQFSQNSVFQPVSAKIQQAEQPDYLGND